LSARAVSLLAAAVVALAMAAGAVLLVLASDHENNKGATIALAITAGLSFVASGLVALWRRPENRTGYLLAAVGYFWFFGALSESNNDWLFTLGNPLGSLAFGAFAHLLLAFPGGRLTSRRDLWIVVLTYVLVVGGTLTVGVLAEHPDRTCTTCRSKVAIGTYERAHDVVDAVTSLLGLVLLATLLVIVVSRFLRAHGALRRALGPVLGAGTVVMLVLVIQIAVDTYSAGAAEPLEYVFLAAFATVPLAFLVGVLRSRLARSGVGDLLLALGRGTPIRDALAGALGDPTLEIAYWLPERERYVSADGKPLPDLPEGRATTLVAHAGGPTAALLHDPMLTDEPELVEAVVAAAGLWLDNERLQARLRAEVAFLEAIVNASPSLLCSINREGRIANLNDAAWHASGYVLESDVKGQMFAEVFVGPEERVEWNRRFEEAAPAHEATSFEHTFVNQLGEQLTIAWSTAPLYDDDGSVRYVVCGGLDITERQRRESERARERDFLRTLADATPSLLVVVDPEGTVVGNSVNRGFERTIGWTEQEMLGRSFLSLFPDDESAEARIGVTSAFNGAKPTERLSHWRTRDGGERAIAWTATPIVDGEGRSLALIVGVDATERQRREAELRSSEERLRAAIEASPVAIVEYALDDNITRWNPAAERIFGWTAEQVLGGPAKHQPPGREEELVELFRRVRAGEVYTQIESKRVRSDGEYIDVEISAAPIRDADGKVLSHMALFADITQRKRQEEELRASRARIVQAADDARRVLERNLHDGAQQRLVALSLSLRLAQAKVGSAPEEAVAVLEAAREELAAALDELRELARGIHPAVLTDRGLEAAVEGLATRSPVPVEFEVPSDELPRQVEAAAYYVIAEALANVIKYADATGVNVRVAREDGRAVVTVSDDGVGGADPAVGSGLNGLADRVEALGGSLKVDSPSRGGTCVTAVIPLQTDQRR
jgi:PAS domain S-box-containing protein